LAAYLCKATEFIGGILLVIGFLRRPAALLHERVRVSRIDMQPEICNAAVGKFALRPEYFAPLSSDVPTLFLSGTLDADTPPMKAERVRWGFSQSTMIVVENGFHETLPSPDVQSLVADFLRGFDVNDRHITFGVPTFLSLDNAKKSTQAHR
jgi:pimeloyl-ACP methyl ester carboxylesterase